ncbi:T9SS type A sorting domain-containing protein [Aquimarina sp. Aq78]|uniref:T9SS type A sorting domain-containing protein n=1 Tax=Aquimarina sp. Aq78 TaxID=1191889 RepID=UPI00131EC082|nr:T9SS type A sorting domain-containing protein [Aquimarina sp. Aq78]
MIVLTQKKWVCSCIALVTLTLSLQAQEVIIPDTKFKQALLRNHNIDTNNNGKIEVSEAQAYTGHIRVSGGPISNLIGIDAFKNITGLSVSKTSIRELDLSKNTKLKTLFFYKNYKVTNLDLSKNIKLKSIGCSYNKLESLTILSRDLIALYCSNNKLNKLFLPNSRKLLELNCRNNKITELKLSRQKELKTLYCENNKLTQLDISNSTKLEQLNCHSNELKSLNISKSTKLIYLYAYNNKLKNLNTSKNTKLTTLDAYDNNLTSLDVSKNTSLERLACGRNNLTSLNVSKNTKLKELYCATSKLTSLNLSKNTKLKTLYCSTNKLTSLNVSKNTKLEYLNCSNNELKSLDVSKNIKLGALNCFRNKLTSLIASNNSKLNYMDARQNSIDCIVGHPTNGATWLKDPKTEFCPEKSRAISRTAKKEGLNQKKIITYPNPVQNILYIQTGQVEKSPVTIALTALNNGRSSTQKRITDNKGVVSIDMSAYKTGVYTIKIITKDRVITRKIVKQ